MDTMLNTVREFFTSHSPSLIAAGLILVAGWLAAKIFRYALLMHGKRPTLPDLLSVMRES